MRGRGQGRRGRQGSGSPHLPWWATRGSRAQCAEAAGSNRDSRGQGREEGPRGACHSSLERCLWARTCTHKGRVPPNYLHAAGASQCTQGNKGNNNASLPRVWASHPGPPSHLQKCPLPCLLPPWPTDSLLSLLQVHSQISHLLVGALSPGPTWGQRLPLRPGWNSSPHSCWKTASTGWALVLCLELGYTGRTSPRPSSSPSAGLWVFKL